MKVPSSVAARAMLNSWRFDHGACPTVSARRTTEMASNPKAASRPITRACACRSARGAAATEMPSAATGAGTRARPTSTSARPRAVVRMRMASETTSRIEITSVMELPVVAAGRLAGQVSGRSAVSRGGRRPRHRCGCRIGSRTHPRRTGLRRS